MSLTTAQLCAWHTAISTKLKATTRTWPLSALVCRSTSRSTAPHSQINRSDQLPEINADKLEPLPLARFDGMELVTPTR